MNVSLNNSYNVLQVNASLDNVSQCFAMFCNVLQVDWEEYYIHYLVDLLGLDQVGIDKSACLRFSFVKITGTNIKTAMLSW